MDTAALTLFKALADDTRLRLLRVLARHELNVGEIVAALGMGQSRISRHLRILVESGLLTCRRDGAWAFYRAAGDGRVGEFLGCLGSLLDDAGPHADLEGAESVLRRRDLETRTFFNAIAGKWRTMRHEALGGLDLTGLIVEVMPECRAAVDLGCGPGDLLPALAARAGTVIGVDSSPQMLKLAAKRVAGLPVSLRVGELEHLPLADGEADFAVASLTLHHLSEPYAAVKEARRVLRHGGKLVLVDFAKHAAEAMRERYGDRWLGFSRQEMEAWCSQAGLAPGRFQEYPVNLGLTVVRFEATAP